MPTTCTMAPGSTATMRKWIVVADDNALLRDLWLEVLDQAGYATVGCQDGFEALERMRDLTPDLVLLDLRMPRTSGTDFLELLRADPRWDQISVVIVSTFLGDAPNPTADARLKIVGRLEKPVSVAVLLGKVGEVLDSSRNN